MITFIVAFLMAAGAVLPTDNSGRKLTIEFHFPSERTNYESAAKAAADPSKQFFTAGEPISFSVYLHALNNGHFEALQAIESSDMVLGREWLAVGDNRTRATHIAAHGQQVAKGEPFQVGGYECRYPGDWNLPVQERARCRCTCVGVIAE